MTLQDFTAAVLIARGALADSDGPALHVIAPIHLAARLGLREYERLVFEPGADRPTASGPEGLRVDYDSPLVEALGGLLDPLSRLAFVQVPAPPLRPIDAQAELEGGVTVRNGVVRLRECATTAAPYLCFVFEYEALADERRAGLLEIWINPDARSVVEWPGLLEAATCSDFFPGTDLGPRLQSGASLASAAAVEAARCDLRDLLESLDRRRARELSRLREYFDGIHQEIARKAQRATRSHVRESEMRRLEATREAHAARVADVMERHRVQVRVWPLVVAATVAPAYRLRVELLRRRTRSEVMLFWNARDRAIEARCCDGCARPIRAADLCDDRAHWLCPACLAPCPVCGRPYCRACHRQCPRGHGSPR